MAHILSDQTVFEGEATFADEALFTGPVTVGKGGSYYGKPPSVVGESWLTHQRVQVSNVADRDALAAWRAANDPITPARPLLVWRADGSSTGVQEITMDGTNWYAESPAAGDIQMTLNPAAPYGWVMMEGQLLANAPTLYPGLWEAASGNLRVGGSTLRVPDMRGRAPIGAGLGAGLTLRTVGTSLGAESVALTQAELPAHQHTGTTGSPDRTLNHDHGTKTRHVEGTANLAGTGALVQVEVHGSSSSPVHPTSKVDQTYATPGNPSAPLAGQNLTHTHTFQTNLSGGGGAAHSNMQPSLVVNFILKV